MVKLKNILFLFGPPLFSFCAGYLIAVMGVNISENQLLAISTGGFITFSLTAGILLLTMPRSGNKYLQRIDEDNRMLGYIWVLVTPGILSVFSAIFSGMKIETNTPNPSDVHCILAISQGLFWASMFTFFWAIIVLGRLIDRANASGKIPGR